MRHGRRGAPDRWPVPQPVRLRPSSSADDTRLRQARRKLGDAETRLRRLQQAIEAGADPDALVDAVNTPAAIMTRMRACCTAQRNSQPSY